MPVKWLDSVVELMGDYLHLTDNGVIKFREFPRRIIDCSNFSKLGAYQILHFPDHPRNRGGVWQERITPSIPFPKECNGVDFKFFQFRVGTSVRTYMGTCLCIGKWARNGHHIIPPSPPFPLHRTLLPTFFPDFTKNFLLFQMILYMGVMFMSYTISFGVSLMFEAPIVSLLRLLSPNRSKKPAG